MKYGITGFGRRAVFVNLTLEEYDQAKAAKANLLHVHSIEEKLDYVLGNYREFEKELLSSSLDHELFPDTEYVEFVENLHLIGRRVVNLLASYRLYADQVPHDISQIYGRHSPQAKSVRDKQEDERKHYLAYRAMWEIRNYVQHCGFPVQKTTQRQDSTDTRVGGQTRCVTIPWININGLAAHNRFDRTVLTELRAHANGEDEIDLRPLVRGYLESVGRIHVHVRGLLKQDIIMWEGTYHGIQKRFEQAGGDSRNGVTIVAIDDNRGGAESSGIFQDFLKRRHALERKNRYLVNYTKRFVSNVAE